VSIKDSFSLRFSFNEKEEKEKLVYEKSKYYSFNKPKPDPKLKQKGVLDFSSFEIASQLVLWEHEMVRQINLAELSSLAWSKKQSREKNAPNILKVIEFSNTIAYWVATEIVTTANLKKRSSILRQFIHIAQHCAKMHFYNGLFEIMAGLNMGLVRRLKQTWKGLSAKTIETFIELEELSSPDDNWRRYRDFLHTLRPGEYPMIPYLGLLLKDLVVIEDSNPTYLENKHVNFKKMRIVVPFLGSFLQIQEKSYPFKAIPDLTLDIIGIPIQNDTELYKKSKFIEPPGEQPIRSSVADFIRSSISQAFDYGQFRNKIE